MFHEDHCSKTEEMSFFIPKSELTNMREVFLWMGKLLTLYRYFKNCCKTSWYNNLIYARTLLKNKE